MTHDFIGETVIGSEQPQTGIPPESQPRLGLMETNQIHRPDDPDQLIFAEEAESNPGVIHSPWKVLLVDDDAAIHQAIRVALQNFSFQHRPLEFISAYSGPEALELLSANPDTAIMLLDVIMETQDAGLRVVQQIRSHDKNRAIRIVLITGQPGQAPEESLILDYDINDYKTKLQLTQQQLFTTLVSSLRTYNDILTLEGNQEELAQLNHQLASLNQTLEHQVRDRTQQLEQNNQQLQQEVAERQHAEEALRIYIHALTHDLRNPVTGMSQVLQSLLQPVMAPPAAGSQTSETVAIPRSILERMAQGCDRQRKMIDRLLEANSIDIWGVSLKRHPFQLDTLLQAMITEWQTELSKKRVTVNLNIEQNLPPVDGDYAQLWRVFENLIENALKYNPPGIQLNISAHEKQIDAQATCIHCCIADTGVGLSQQQQAEIFMIYQRGQVRHALQGLGLGLYICRSIIEAHGGKIEVDGAPQQGTAFSFSLPTLGTVIQEHE